MGSEGTQEMNREGMRKGEKGKGKRRERRERRRRERHLELRYEQLLDPGLDYVAHHGLAVGAVVVAVLLGGGGG